MRCFSLLALSKYRLPLCFSSNLNYRTSILRYISGKRERVCFGSRLQLSLATQVQVLRDLENCRETWLKGIPCQDLWQEVDVLTLQRRWGSLNNLAAAHQICSSVSFFWELVRG